MKKSTLLGILIGVVILLILISIFKENPSISSIITPPTSTTATNETETIYTNKEAGFQFTYPKEWGEVSKFIGTGDDNDTSAILFIESGPLQNFSVGYVSPTFSAGRDIGFIEQLAGITTSQNWTQTACNSEILKNSVQIVASCKEISINGHKAIEVLAFDCFSLGCDGSDLVRKADFFKTDSKVFPTLVFSIDIPISQIGLSNANKQHEIIKAIETGEAKQLITIDDISKLRVFDRLIQTVNLQ